MILFFGFIVTRPTTLSFGKLGKEHSRIEFWVDFLDRRLQDFDTAIVKKSSPTIVFS
jgi:hypothetical protein